MLVSTFPIANITDENFQKVVLGDSFRAIKKASERRRKNTQAVVEKLEKWGVIIYDNLVDVNQILELIATSRRKETLERFNPKNSYNI